MPKLQMKRSTFLSLFKAKEVLQQKKWPIAKEVICGGRIGTVLKAKVSRSYEIEREML